MGILGVIEGWLVGEGDLLGEDLHHFINYCLLGEG